MTRRELVWSRLNGQHPPKKDEIRRERVDVIQSAGQRTDPTTLTTMGPFEGIKWISPNGRSGHEAAPADEQRSVNTDRNWHLWRLLPKDSEFSRDLCLDTIKSCYGRHSRYGARLGVDRLVAAADGEKAA
jgi:hypothetical protein